MGDLNRKNKQNDEKELMSPDGSGIESARLNPEESYLDPSIVASVSFPFESKNNKNSCVTEEIEMQKTFADDLNENYGLIEWIVQKFEKTADGKYVLTHGLLEREDMLSIASFAYWRATENYSADRNASLATFASVCMRFELSNATRKLVRNHKKLQKIKNSDDDVFFGNTCKQKHDLEPDYVTDRFLDVMVATAQLATENAAIMFLSCFSNYTLDQIGEMMGLSKSSVSKRRKKSIESIEEIMDED